MFGIPIGGYNSCLKFLSSAIREVKVAECCNLLLTKGNTDSTPLSYKYKTTQEGYPCFPVKACLFRFKDGEVYQKSVILYRPVGIRLFEVSDTLGSERYIVHANILGCDSSTAKRGYNYLKWTVPYTSVVYTRDVQKTVERALKNAGAESCTSMGDSMYAFEFGQEYGEKAFELHNTRQYRLNDGDPTGLLKRGFFIKDLECQSKLVTLRAINSFISLQSNIYIGDWGSEPCQDASVMLECFGDAQHNILCLSKFMGFCGVYPIALSLGKDDSPEIVCISAKPTKGSIAPYSIVRRKLFSELEKEDCSKVDGLTFYSDSVKLSLLDREILLERSVLNSLIGCGVTAQSQKDAAASILAGIGNFTIWGDGSLRNVSLTGTSLRIPPTVTSIAKEALGNAGHYSGSTLTDIVIPASVTKIDKKAFLHPDDTYVKPAHREKVFSAPIYFASISDSVVEQMFKALLTMLDDDYVTSKSPVFAYKENDHEYNVTLLVSLLKAASTTQYKYLLTKRNSSGISESMSLDDAKKYFTASDIYSVIRMIITYELLSLFDRTRKITVPSSDKFMNGATYEYFDHLRIVPRWGRGYQLLSNLMVLWKKYFELILKDEERLLRLSASHYLEAIKAYRLCYKALRDHACTIKGYEWVERQTVDPSKLYLSFETRLTDIVNGVEVQ